MIFQSVLTVFQIILCRFVPSQFLLIMFTQLNLKSFIKYALKKSSQVRESENLSETKYTWKYNTLTCVIRTI